MSASTRPRPACGESTPGRAAAAAPSLSELLQEPEPPLPRGVLRRAVLGRRVRHLALAHEAVTGALVDHGLERLAEPAHALLGRGQAGVHARVVLGVEAVDGAGDAAERGLVVG